MLAAFQATLTPSQMMLTQFQMVFVLSRIMLAASKPMLKASQMTIHHQYHARNISDNADTVTTDDSINRGIACSIIGNDGSITDDAVAL